MTSSHLCSPIYGEILVQKGTGSNCTFYIPYMNLSAMVKYLIMSSPNDIGISLSSNCILEII